MPLVSSRTIGAFLAGLLALACDRNSPGPRAEARHGSGASAATRSAERTSAPLPVLRGDTFDLVTTLTADEQSPAHGRSPCNSVADRYSEERIVFSTDSIYELFAVLRRECWDKSASSSDTLETASIYRLRGDTVLLYTGDGDEIYESGSVRIVGDSLVPVGENPTDSARLVRRHHLHH